METDELQVLVGDSPEKDITVIFPADFPDSSWITVVTAPDRPKFSVRIARSDEGILIDVFPYDNEMEDPVASTYAFDSEVADTLTHE